MADIGEGITQVQVLQWYVQPGSTVKQFDRIAEVQSDKATVEITSRFDGTISKLHYKAGEDANVGSPLVDIEVLGEEKEKHDNKEINTSSDATETIEGNAKVNAISNIVSQDSNVNLNAGTYKVLPSVRKRAKELGVDLSKVTPTGRFGQITLEDLNVPMAGTIPLTPFQKAMTKAMNLSLSIPHFGYHDEIAMDRLMRVREELQEKTKLTLLPFILKALSLALQDFPQLNCHFDSENEKVIQYTDHNIGVAIDTDHGLAVPVIHGVQNMSVFQVASELTRLTQLARANKLPPASLKGASITVSNIGTIGGTTASPIIPHPQVAIVALGRAQCVPRFVNDGSIQAVTLMPVSWSADHRIIDGATIARFSQRWKQIIESPSLILK